MSLIRTALSLFALGLLLSRPATAALVEYTGGGQIVEIIGPAPDDLSTDPATQVAFSFVFDLEREPVAQSESLATYEALTAYATLDDGDVVPLASATLLLARHDDGYVSYLFQGTSGEGWVLRYYAESRDPDFLPSFDLPEESPEADDVYAAVSLDDAAGEWSAYSDNIGIFETRVMDDDAPTQNGISLDLSLPLLGDLSLHLGRP